MRISSEKKPRSRLEENSGYSSPNALAGTMVGRIMNLVPWYSKAVFIEALIQYGHVP